VKIGWLTLSSSESTQILVADSLPSAATPAARFSNKRAYAQTFAATVAVRCFGAVSGVLAARLLGPTGRGELAVIIFLPLVLILIGELELPRSLAFEVSRDTEVSAKVVASGFWLALGLGCIQSVVLAAALPIYLPPDKVHLLFATRWFMVYLPAAYISFALTGIDQGRGRFGRFSFFLTLPTVLYVAAILIGWGTGHVSPTAFATGVLAAMVLTACARAALSWKVLTRTKPDWVTSRRLLKRGFSFYLPAIASFLLSRCDMFLIVRLVPIEAIGLYAVAQAISIGQIGAVNPFVQVGFAAVARDAEPEQAIKTLARHFRFAALAAIIVGSAAAAATPWGIHLFFGFKFIGATKATFLLIAASAFWGMAQVLDQGLRAASHPRPGIFSNLLGAAVVFTLGIPACLHFGIDGMAASVVVAQFLNLALLLGFCVVRLKVRVDEFWAFRLDTLRGLWQAFRRSEAVRELQTRST
jgi:O-antigen/teichoic acid export membrane protein